MFNNGGMRNIGSNGNQPLITNQNDFQLFDNVTRVAGKHTMKAGGSYTHRSREILNADTIVGRFDFNQNLTSSCGGVTGTCTPIANTGFDLASFLLGYASNASRTFFDPGTLHRASARNRAVFPGRHSRQHAVDGERWPAVGPLQAMDRGRQQAVEFSMYPLAGSSSRPTMRRSTALRWGDTSRPTARPTLVRGSDSPTT
jgi:hypothetical protein